MRRNTFILLFLLLSLSGICQQSKQKLLGTCAIDDLTKEPFATWYLPGYKKYSPNTEVLSHIKSRNPKKYSVKIFFGTWCGDSQRELPRMSKILNELSIPEENVLWIALDDSLTFYKQSPQHEEQGLNIYRVPTFIVYEKEKEVGRIVEFPKESLERDLLKIIDRQPYESNYQGYPSITVWLQSGILKDPNISARGLAEELHSKISRETELNACGYVLLMRGNWQEAITVFKINANLFPTSANCFDSLGEAYLISGQKEKSIETYEYAQTLDPKNENIKNQLAKLKKG